MPVTGAWYTILRAARRCGRRDQFDSFALAQAAGLEPHVASAYLGLFAKWGYVRRFRRHGRRQQYILTRWGREFRPR